MGRLLRLILATLAGALALVATSVTLSTMPAGASGTTTWSDTETIPVPPASAYAGSGSGDGWAVALSSDKVFNVFHHSGSLTVACHNQADATQCWAPKTITDASGNGFATSGQPGLWLDQASGKLYVYATRTSDATGGVVCIDTTSSANDPFCNFTALTSVGDAPIVGGISVISDPVLEGTNWFAFNYVSGSGVIGTRNTLLCFNTASAQACGNQPYAVSIGTGALNDGYFPPPETAGIGGDVIVPATTNGDHLACFNPSTLASCAGSWPVTLASSYDSTAGAPIPLLSSTGTTTGLCLPTGSDPCYDMSGNSTPTPSGMTSVITGSDGWNGPALVLGPRDYVPNGNSGLVECFDFSTNTSCSNFPKSLPSLGYLYTVNPDPQRPTCIWVNADNGASQIQNFDAYTGGACGQGAIRVLASNMVAPGSQCVPYTYSQIKVLQPPATSYTSGTVDFEDSDANPITGAPQATLDSTGAASLNGLNLNSGIGLPEFLITLTGAQGAPTSVVVQLTWTGLDDPSCVPINSGAKRNVLFVHGINGNYLDFQCLNQTQMSPMYATLHPICADPTRFIPNSFRYYQDKGTGGVACAQQPDPVTLTGNLWVDPNSMDQTKCDSEGALGYSAAGLDVVLQATASPTTVMGTSMGGAITRGWLSLANYSHDSSISHTDSVIFLQGAQQGSWAAGGGEAFAGGGGIPLLRSLTNTIANAIAGRFNLNVDRPGVVDLAPVSRWYGSVNPSIPSPGVPPQLAYYNFYSNINILLQFNFFFFHQTIGSVDIGDGALLPGTNNPNGEPAGGGAKFLPGNADTTNRHQFSMDGAIPISPTDLTGPITIGLDIDRITSYPISHLSFPGQTGSIMVTGCGAGSPTVSVASEVDRILHNPTAGCAQ